MSDRSDLIELRDLVARAEVAEATIARIEAVLADDWSGDGSPINVWTRLAAVRAALASGQQAGA
jgi:hypothetical protein